MKKKKKGRPALAADPPTPMYQSALAMYIAQTRDAFEWHVAHALTDAERKDQRQSMAVMMWEIQTTRKYKLTPSALQMIERLKPDKSGIIENLPGTGLWANLDDSSRTSIYFSSMPLAALSYAEKHQVKLIGM